MTSESDRDGAPDERSADPARTGVFVADTDAEREDAFAVRRSVFVDEQGVDPGIEYDDHDEPDAEATHFVAYDEGEPIGAARLRPAGESERTPESADESSDSSTAKVERVAVDADRRGEGWGRRLMDAVEARAREVGFDRLTLHAQTHVREFYERLAYEAYGETFEEAGILHVAMEKRLDG